MEPEKWQIFHMVYYRKYRPQKIEDLDSAKLRETLYSIFSTSNYPHAFLFTGPKGLGKTSTARIVAKIVNCEGKGESGKGKEQGKKEKKLNASPLMLNPSIEPCNECEQCISITNGSNLDVLEIDAASNRGIDEIRDLRDKIRLAPIRAAKKVYIIDEVHMLTTEAFNALLKTLEEPPEHALFILCTTEFHKIPSTILSRSFHIALKQATRDELLRSFNRIIDGEKIKIDKEALEYITTIADGSFRDATKMLEEIVSLAAGKEITKEFVEEKYKVSAIGSSVENVLQSLFNNNIKAALKEISNVVEQGIDMKYFLEQILSELHSLLLLTVGMEYGGTLKNVSVIEQKVRLEDLKQLIELFSKAHSELKYAVLSQLPLEIAVISWKQGELRENLPHGAGAARETSNTEVKVSPASLSERRTTDKDPEPTEKVGSTFSSPAHGQTLSQQVSAQSSASGFASVSDKEFLYKLIDAVKVTNQSTAGLLRSSQVMIVDDTLTVEAAYKFHADKLSEQKTILLLEQAAQNLTGKKVRVSVILKR